MKACRHSGLPVKLENLEAYKLAWEAAFDAAKSKHGNDMLSLQKELVETEAELLTKYQAIEEWPELVSVADFAAKIKEYEAPIMVAQSSEKPDELVYVIMDKNLL